MKTLDILTNNPLLLPQGKADFLLAASVTKTCEIEGITQAGIPGKIAYTPTLDAEFIVHQKLFSMQDIAETPSGVPTPALITRAVHNLNPFSTLEILDLGLSVKPQNVPLHSFGILPSNRIDEGAKIDARAIIEKGMAFGRSYTLKGNSLILAESTPAGTTTATACALALGYDLADAFSSSFLNVPNEIKTATIQKALLRTDDTMTKLEKLGIVGDNMLLFCVGFLIEASKRFEIILGGGTQMAACLLIADALREDLLVRINHHNVTLATTQWVAKDPNSDIAKILSSLSYTPKACYTPFRFTSAEIPVLKKYDEGEAKEGVGAGAALAHAAMSGLDERAIVEAVELIMYEMM